MNLFNQFAIVTSGLQSKLKINLPVLCIFLVLGSLGFSTGATAQSDSDVPPHITTSIATLWLLFPLDGVSNQSHPLPKNISVVGLEDRAKKIYLEQIIKQGIETRDESALIPIFKEYSLSIDMENSSETTVALRVSVSVSLEEKLASHVQNGDFEKSAAILEQNSLDLNLPVVLANQMIGFTPLTFAIINQDQKLVELLLGHGANPDTSGTGDALPPLSMAVVRQNLELTRTLLDAGASVEIDHNKIAREPLALWAAKTNDLSLINLLIEHGVDPSQVGSNGWTPLTEAIRLNHIDMVEFLVDINDPRVSTAAEKSFSMANRFDSGFFPASNALHLARHLLEPTDSERVVKRILQRAKELGGESAVTMLELDAYTAASQLAYDQLNLSEAIEQLQLAVNAVDVFNLDTSSDAALIHKVKSGLVNLHELSVIDSQPFSPENRQRAAHIGKLTDEYIKWHDMLDVMTAASEGDATTLIEEWREKHGELKQAGWNYDMLLSWADERIEKREDRIRVYQTVDEFRLVNVFTK